MNSHILEFRKKLKSKLSPMRYEHSLSVSFICISLAMRHGGSLEQAELAGLLHDCAKRYDDDAILEHCAKHHIVLTDDERKVPAVLHAKYGAWMVENRYHVPDDAVIGAVACHTTGKPDMSLLDKILYTADYIEPRRYQAENLGIMRRLAYEDLDEAVFRIMESTLAYLQRKGTPIDPISLEAYDYYRIERSIKKGD